MQKTNPRLHLYKLGLLSCEWVYSWLDGSAIMSLVGVHHGPGGADHRSSDSRWKGASWPSSSKLSTFPITREATRSILTLFIC